MISFKEYILESFSSGSGSDLFVLLYDINEKEKYYYIIGSFPNNNSAVKTEWRLKIHNHSTTLRLNLDNSDDRIKLKEIEDNYKELGAKEVKKLDKNLGDKKKE